MVSKGKRRRFKIDDASGARADFLRALELARGMNGAAETLNQLGSVKQS